MPDNEKLTHSEEQALLALMEDVKDHQRPVSSALYERIVADAAELAVASDLPHKKPGWRDRFSGMFEHLGGLRGASVMTACALFGLSFGYAGPESLISIAGLTEVAIGVSDLDAEIDIFETSSFDFEESGLLQ